MEWVLIVVPQYTQIAYQLLVSTKCVPRAWHLEGRYGSRTHEYYEPNNNNNNSNINKECTANETNIATTSASAIDIDSDAETSSRSTNTQFDDNDTTNSIPNKQGRRMIGIPVLSKEHVYEAIKTNTDLYHMLHSKQEDAYLLYKPYSKSTRQHEPPFFDAQIHIERRPLSFGTIESYLFHNKHQNNQADNTNSSTNDNDSKAVGTTTTTTTNITDKSFTYAELFAGIGGFGIALDALGGQCIFCSEINESCRNVYTANLLLPKMSQENIDQILYGDIYKVTDDQLPTPGTLDILVGGFPCQPFSSLGDQPGFNCPDGNLFLQIVRVLKVSQPKAFLFENVPGLVQMKETIQTIIKAFEECNYIVSMEICDARCLTATTRKRLYIVGLRRKQSNNAKDTQEEFATNTINNTPQTESNADCINHNNNDGDNCEPFQFPYIPDLKLRARHVIDYEQGCDDNDETDILHISDEQLNRMNNEKYWKPAHLAWPNTVIDTLVSHYGKSVARGHSQLVPCSAISLSRSNKNQINKSNPRRFTPRECARLMGFPNSYILPPKRDPDQCMMGYNKMLYEMFGNAVCPPIIAAIMGAVLDRCCFNISHQFKDWVDWGRTIAIQLAYNAILPDSYKVDRQNVVLSKDELISLLQTTSVDLLFTSESDFPIKIFQLPPSTPTLQIDNITSTLLSPTIMPQCIDSRHRNDWTTEPIIEKSSLDWFFRRYIAVEEWWEPIQHDALPRWTMLYDLFKNDDYFLNVEVLRIGQGTDYGLNGSIDIFIIGRYVVDGTVIGLHTISVET